MNSDPYSATVRDLFRNPAHAGDLDDGFSTQVREQGVRLCLTARAVGGSIRRLRFRAWGCPHVIAAAEAFCAGYEGRPAADLQTFAAAQLMQSLPVPVEKTGRILVLEDAVRSLGQMLCDASGRTD